MNKLVLLLVAFICMQAVALATWDNASVFGPKTDDLGWMKYLSQDAPILASDINLISVAAENEDYKAIAAYYDLALIDSRKALNKSQGYVISSKLKEAKYYWETALAIIINGAERGSIGGKLKNEAMMVQGSEMMVEGNEYLALAAREIVVATVTV